MLSLAGWALGPLVSPALACGGLFCDAQQPVDQTGERILFVLDEAADAVEMHVQISYQGPSEDFSWILPVASVPELFVSSDDVLARLALVTTPTFVPTQETVGTCTSSFVNQSKDDSVDVAPPSDEDGGVTVVGAAPVGPYDSVTLQATDAATLVAWLTDNGYDLPEGAEARIAPYIGSGSAFVALKLQKDRDSGDIVPLGLRYAGSDPVIPLQLTGVAAAPDFRLQPYVLGARRAVPENYLHVVINELAVDWLAVGANYQDVVARAADEAGGLAFATDFAGPHAATGVLLWREDQVPLAAIASMTSLAELETVLVTPFLTPGSAAGLDVWGLPVTTATAAILDAYVTPPTNVELVNYLSCMSCYGSPVGALDGASLAEALESAWAAPLRRVQAHLDAYPYLTRLTSSISAAEMSLDPRFVLNDTLGDVAGARQAVVQTLCSGLHGFNEAPRRLVLADGTTLELPSRDDVAAGGFDWASWVAAAGSDAALRVEQTGRSGDAVVLVDNGPSIRAAADAFNRAHCGCDQGSWPASWAGVVAIAFGVRRRRR
ncbi:MAG: hypothetical protein RLZZ383_1889 [Pseudomonadota bacterium]